MLIYNCVILFEKYVTAGSIVLVYVAAMGSIRESNSWSLLGWARFRPHRYTAYSAFLCLRPKGFIITTTTTTIRTEEAIHFYRDYVIIVPATRISVIINGFTYLRQYWTLWTGQPTSDKISTPFCKHTFLLYTRRLKQCSFHVVFRSHRWLYLPLVYVIIYFSYSF
jgi:hypothetical protein